MGFGWCKRLFGDLCSLGPKDLLHPPLSTFGNFPFSVNFPGPQLPNTGINCLRDFSVMTTDWETNFTDLQANGFGDLCKQIWKHFSR